MTTNGTSGGLDGASKLLARLGPAVMVTALTAVLGVYVLSHVGCGNHHTPPGNEGYIRAKPLLGSGHFVGVQKGPTSTGWVWRQDVVNIDVRPRTFSELMTIRTSQGSDLTFRAHTRIKLRDGGVRVIVENMGGANWYEANVQKSFQRAIREKVQTLEPFAVKNQSLEIADVVLAVMRDEYKDSPVEFLSVDIGDIEYPEAIVESVIKKFVTIEENQRKDIELEIAQRQIDIGIAEAEGISDSQRIIRRTLDPMFLQYEALGAIEQLAGSPNTTFVVVPMGKDGAAPIIMGMDK